MIRYAPTPAAPDLDFAGPTTWAALAAHARYVAACEREEAARLLASQGVAYVWTRRTGRVACTTLEHWDAAVARG